MPAYIENAGTFALWRGEAIDGILHSLQIADLWSEAELAEVGLYRPAEADPVPEGQRIVSTSVERVDGVVKFVHELAPIVPTADDVDAERDRRIASDFTFGGVVYQSRPSDLKNIAGASTAALGAMMAGAQPGDLFWHGGTSEFTWIAADNSTTPMDAQTLFAFGQAAMAHKQAHIFAARALKDMDPIPSDYATNEAYWP
ncbi:DUF4376 domain-containing protein [Aquibium microcysteis]|uniref:DUF4376 domain-containing protein n=1 Tax=Aquibium microcysteis TaxID=675281 RepID=UPI00165D014C|nr:DUF4376 domain-containing protein [Aquibium microcysteis]